MDISIIVPINNEEDNIRLIYDDLTRTLSNAHGDHEIIFIDDGSVDSSLAVLRGLRQSDSRVKIICFDKNYGQTSALDAGFKQASGQIILTIDADLQYNARDLLRVLEELMKDDVDAVFGKRGNRTSGLFKKICSQTAIFIRNLVLNESYQDASLAGYKKQCLQKLILYRDTQVFIPVFLRIQGFRIKEIDVKEYARKHGRSKYNLSNRLFRLLYALFAIKWLKNNQLKYKISNIT